MASNQPIFVSYDTREKAWATFLRDVFESRFQTGSTFVAVVDIKAGDPGIETLLGVLRQAEVVVPICSHLSRTSPWLWWEAAAAWAREKVVLPLFLGISGSELGGPMGVAQGRDFDAAGIDDVIKRIGEAISLSTTPAPLTVPEREQLQRLVAERARGPRRIDTEGRSCQQDGQNNYELCRVRISNAGSTTIHGVQVVVSSFSPHGVTFLPVLLQRMHGHLPGYPHPFSVNPGEDVYVDVVDWRPTQGIFALRYNDSQLKNDLTPGRYEIELSASATNLPSATCTLVAELNAQQHLELKPK